MAVSLSFLAWALHKNSENTREMAKQIHTHAHLAISMQTP